MPIFFLTFLCESFFAVDVAVQGLSSDCVPLLLSWKVPSFNGVAVSCALMLCSLLAVLVWYARTLLCVLILRTLSRAILLYVWVVRSPGQIGSNEVYALFFDSNQAGIDVLSDCEAIHAIFTHYPSLIYRTGYITRVSKQEHSAPRKILNASPNPDKPAAHNTGADFRATDQNTIVSLGSLLGGRGDFTRVAVSGTLLAVRRL